MTKAQKELWDAILMFVSASNDQEESARSKEEAEEYNAEKWAFLDRFIVRRKPQKLNPFAEIFGRTKR